MKGSYLHDFVVEAKVEHGVHHAWSTSSAMYDSDDDGDDDDDGDGVMMVWWR